MLVPLSWLKQYVDPKLPVDQLGERLSLSGLEVESVRRVGDWWDPAGLVVARVAAVRPHPNADRLVVLDLEAGGPRPEQVVTGAPNLVAFKDKPLPPDLKIPFARPGASVLDAAAQVAAGADRPRKKVQSATLRGVASAGVVCSERELGISDAHEGVLILPGSAPVGTPLAQFLADDVLEVAILPDTARCTAMTGVAREVAALTASPLSLPPPPELPAAEGKDRTADYVGVSIADPSLGYRYMALVVKDVRIAPSPAWLRDRLVKCGVKPINNVVDVTNYVMLEWGQPTHAFDYRVLKARAAASGGAASGENSDRVAITVRPAAPGETLTTLDGTSHPLDPSMLLIADAAGPLALAGVMGGRDTEINPDTRVVLLEVASFDRVAVRRTAQKLKLATEASYRYSRGIPQKMVEVAARRAAQLLAELAGGRVVAEPVDCYPTPQPRAVIFLTPGHVRRTLGIDVPATEIRSVLEKLDFEVQEGEAGDWPWRQSGESAFGLQVADGETLLRCVAPWYRLDARVPADLVEEVVRMIGFERLDATLIAEQMPRVGRDPVFDAEEKIRDTLVGCGLQEIITYALTTPEAHERLGLAAPGADTPYVTLANPLTTDRRVMRRSMLVGAVEDVVYNARFTSRLATFEIGRVYLPEQGDGRRPREERRLSLTLVGPRRPAALHADPAGAEPFDFYDLKGVVEALLRKCGARSDVTFTPLPAPGDNPQSAPGSAATFTARSAEVRVRGERAGVIGELSPFAQAALGVTLPPILLAELSIASLIGAAAGQDWVVTVNRSPSVKEDLAFVVEERVPAGDVLAAIRSAGGDTLAEAQLFDVFRGPPLAPATKSLAFQVAYRAPDRLLAEPEVVALRQRIVAEVAAETGGALRGG